MCQGDTETATKEAIMKTDTFYCPQITIEILDAPSEAVSAIKFVGTKYNSEVGDIFVTFRKTNKTYRYEGVSLDKALGLLNVVSEVIDGDSLASIGFEIAHEIKGGGYECELVA